ncbi:MAG: DUF1648 domain-containing protein [SAR202 cluster bacterium]|nr:DUF1648 domain-containing protein [SAR202 cluster bacterium]
MGVAAWIGIGAGAILALLGWATYKLAPRVGPNPIFGVRTGYSMVNREVWDKSNRAGGIAIAGVGALTAFAGVILDLLAPWSENALILITAGVVVTGMVITFIWAVRYSRRLSEGVKAESARPIKVPLAWLWASALVAAVSIAFVLATISDLPPSVATHFALDGTANDWTSRTGYAFMMAGLVVGMLALTAGIFYLVSHVDIPGADGWAVSGESGMVFFAVAMFGAQLLIAVVLWDIYWFNTRGKHPFPLDVFAVVALVASLVAIPAGLVWMVLRARRNA